MKKVIRKAKTKEFSGHVYILDQDNRCLIYYQVMTIDQQRPLKTNRNGYIRDLQQELVVLEERSSWEIDPYRGGGKLLEYVFDAGIGKLMVGAYLKEVEGCTLVSYNPTSGESTEKTGALVAGKKVKDGEVTVYLCEVFTSLNTIKLQGRPEGERWSDFGNENTQYTLEQLWSQFKSSYKNALTSFGDADHLIFQLWAPKVRSESMMNGLVQLAKEFEEEYRLGIGLIINEEYSSRMATFVETVSDETDGPSERALKVVQSINDLQADMN